MNSQAFDTRECVNVDLEKDSGRTDTLSAFRQQVGITDVLESGTRTSKRKASNIGIYNRIIIEERDAKWQYIFCALLINTCLLAQIVLASALTALGAGSGSHTQITILGAANTVIAALLTFTKGQGLPNRLRQYQCSLRKVREYIEQRERDFAQLDCNLDLNVEVRLIKGMYEDARQNDENNDPSTYHAPAVSSTKGQFSTMENSHKQSLSRTTRPAPSAAPPMSHMEDVKDEEHMATAEARNVHADSPRHKKSEDSEKWKIAQSVADKLVSSRHAW